MNRADTTVFPKAQLARSAHVLKLNLLISIQSKHLEDQFDERKMKSMEENFSIMACICFMGELPVNAAININGCNFLFYIF